MPLKRKSKQQPAASGSLAPDLLSDLPLTPNPGLPGAGEEAIDRVSEPPPSGPAEGVATAGPGEDPEKPGRRGWWLALLFLLLPLALALGYYLRPGPAVAVLSTALADFGALPLEAEPKSLALELGNQGEQPMRVLSITLAGEGREGFRLAEDSCSGQSVPRLASCRLLVSFQPEKLGRYQASLEVRTNAPNSLLRLPLSGSVLAPRLDQQIVEMTFDTLLPGVSGSARSFWAANGGTADLHLGQLRFEGAAAEDFFPAEDSCSARTLTPGSRCRLGLYFVPALPGPREAVLVVESDAPEGDLRVRLFGSGLAEQPLLVASGDTLDFSTVPVGEESGPMAIELSNGGKGELSISEARPASPPGSAPGYSFELVEESCTRTPLAPTEACRLSLIFRPRAEEEIIQEFLVFHNAADEPWRLTLRGKGGLGHAEISHQRLSLGEVALGRADAEGSIRLSNVGDAPMQVGEASLGGSDASAFVLQEDGCSGRRLPPGRACSINLVFSPRRNGPHRGELFLPHDVDSGQEAVRLSGIGVSARLEAIPERLNFGESRVGRSQELAVNLANSGRAKVRVERIRLAGSNRSDLRILEDGCSRKILLPGAACKIRLRFTPAAPGPRRAEVEVTHDASGSLLKVPLTGIGRL